MGVTNYFCYILNTPYFINAIQQGVYNFRYNTLIKNQYITEGNVFYKNYNGQLTSDQTTSMLGTNFAI